MRVNVGLPVRHRATREINKRDGAGECVIEQESSRIGLEILRQNSPRLQIRDLTGSERDQLAHPLVESGSGACPQQIGNFRSSIGLEVITVTELMVRGEEPPRIRLDALKRTDVVFQIDMPAGSMSIFLALRIRRHWI
jgi:hypothetical protein